MAKQCGALFTGSIELAVAPVFLLAGIGALLNVMAQRLARVVERVRTLERVFPASTRSSAAWRPPSSPSSIGA